ncbi:hypothetical protein HPB52_025199 [Rhipicephalus sanguineus]|uniref:Uncharacterized protein n=1 Tax=Rhipicephalus sanguineus TaxID=34632 RepID=A0A9D4YRL2_RHISA|nr:hypothetical protein HPB52_025199 [Rhipicephalus sanguineus]
MDPVPIHNRYDILASLDGDDTHVAPGTRTHDSATPSYSGLVGSSSSRPRHAPSVLGDVQLPLANDESEIDSHLASLEKEIQHLKQHRALLQRRRDGTHSLHTPSASTATPTAQTLVSAPKSQSLSPQELLRFVAQQLQHLTSVLPALRSPGHLNLNIEVPTTTQFTSVYIPAELAAFAGLAEWWTGIRKHYISLSFGSFRLLSFGWKPNAFKQQLGATNAAWNAAVRWTGAPHLGLRRLMPLYGAPCEPWNAVGGLLTP